MANFLKYQALKAGTKAAKDGFETALLQLDPEDPTQAGLIAIILSTKDVKCGFCHGHGHHPKQCSSKKNLDKAVENAPAMRILWGSCKAKYASTAKKTSAALAGQKRLHTDSVKIKNGVDQVKHQRAQVNGAMEDDHE